MILLLLLTTVFICGFIIGYGFALDHVLYEIDVSKTINWKERG